MNDYFISANEAEKHADNNISFTKIFFVGLGLVLLIALVGGFTYFLGIKSSISSSDPIPTPDTTTTENAEAPTVTATPSPSPQPSEDDDTPTDEASPTPTPLTREITLEAVGNLDGYINSSGTKKVASEVRAGFGLSIVSRGFYSFEIDEIPAGANIVSGTLRLYQMNTEGQPYDIGGNLLIDHLTYGNSLDEKDYSTPAILYGFDVLSENNSAEFKEVNVTERLKENHINSLTYSQYRIHFEEESVEGSGLNFTYFESSENYFGTGNTPELVVEYTIK